MLKSSGRRYSSSSESQAEVEDVGDDEEHGENAEPSSTSSRWSSEPILSLGTRWDRWK